jgi:hypothetical protein
LGRRRDPAAAGAEPPARSRAVLDRAMKVREFAEFEERMTALEELKDQTR